MKVFQLTSVIPVLFMLVWSVIAMGCAADRQPGDELKPSVVIQEAFHTERDEGDNVDSPAVWHGPDGQHWLLATAKEGNLIIVYDAADGSLISRVGEGGTKKGQFRRPNGITIIDDLMLVAERDNHRIQVFRLPEFTALGTFGEEYLKLPYGITIDRTDDHTYELYISDNYNPALEGYPLEEQLDERIHQFRLTVEGNSLKNEHVRAFGDIQGKGILHKVESLYIDRAHNRLMIADESFRERSVKVYDLKGNFTGTVIPNIYFDSEPEGIALYRCDNNSGYWIMTDQHETESNKFEVFDRETLEHLGTFKGKITRNTDGVWLTQEAFGNFPKGAFYPVHNDGSVTAISWAEVMDSLNIGTDCTTAQ